MAYRFLLDLAVGGFDDEPVRNLRAWVQRRPMEEFLALIVDNERRRVVRSETRTGWRRGDIIPLRTHMSWPQRTT